MAKRVEAISGVINTSRYLGKNPGDDERGWLVQVGYLQLEGADGQDALLCPVRTLEVYLDRTKQFRSPDQQKLIIPYRRGSVKDMTKQTLLNYIKETIVLAYQEQDPDSQSQDQYQEQDPDSQSLLPLQVKRHSMLRPWGPLGQCQWRMFCTQELTICHSFLSQGICSNRINDFNFYSVLGSSSQRRSRSRNGGSGPRRLITPRAGLSRQDEQAGLSGSY